MKTGLRIAPAVMMLASFGAWAQTPAAPALPQKIAVINMQEALLQTVDGKKAVADMRAKYGPREQEFQKRAQDLQAKQEQYRKTQATLSDDAKAKTERDIETMTRTLQRDQDDYKADIDSDQQRVLQDLGGKIMQVITRYAADNKFTMVFDDSGQPNNILFASNAIDITRDVIALYDKSVPTTPTAPPAAAPASKPATTTTTSAPKAPPSKQP